MEWAQEKGGNMKTGRKSGQKARETVRKALIRRGHIGKTHERRRLEVAEHTPGSCLSKGTETSGKDLKGQPRLGWRGTAWKKWKDQDETQKEEEAGFSFSMVTPNSRKEQNKVYEKPSRKQSDPGMISLLIQVESSRPCWTWGFQECGSQEALSCGLEGNFRWWERKARAAGEHSPWLPREPAMERPVVMQPDAQHHKPLGGR